MNADQALRNMFTKAAKRYVRIDDEMHVFIGDGMDDKVEKLIKRAMSLGKTVVENKVSRWITNYPLINSGQTGSAVYQWHKDGERVRTERFLWTKQPNGKVTKVSLGLSWTKDIE